MENINALYKGVLLCLFLFPTLLLYKSDRGGLQRPKINFKISLFIIIICLYSTTYIAFTHFIINVGEGNWQRLWYIENYPLVSFWALTLLICMIAPILEEVFFRGHLYNFAIKFKIPLPLWFIITTAAWLSLHFGFELLEHSVFFIWGYMLAYLRHVSQSIIPNIIIHIAHNCLVWFQPAELQFTM